MVNIKVVMFRFELVLNQHINVSVIVTSPYIIMLYYFLNFEAIVYFGDAEFILLKYT